MKERNKRVLVGMSGGIDSTATCLMLQEQGYEIVGVTMRVWGDEPQDARELAARMGIEHYVADERIPFKETIVRNFIDEYKQGRSPNPCVMCNPLFKFRVLAEWADKLDCAYIATGHYSRLEERSGHIYIVAGDDDKKDQSYFLWRLGQDILKRCIFPLGDYTKIKVREYLAEKGYHLADEQMLIDAGKYYNLLDVRVHEMVQKDEYDCSKLADDWCYMYGGSLLRKKDPVLRSWLVKRRDTTAGLINSLSGKNTENAAKRLKTVKAEQKTICAVLKQVYGIDG